MGSCRYVYNCGCCVELQCSLLVDRDAAGRVVELIEPIDELCYIFAGCKWDHVVIFAIAATAPCF
jgi:hypothetical protein